MLEQIVQSCLQRVGQVFVEACRNMEAERGLGFP